MNERRQPPSRRSILTGVAAASAATAVALPATAATAPRGRIMELYLEHWRRSDELFGSKDGKDVTDEELDWTEEPIYEALEIEPKTVKDWGAIVLLVFYANTAPEWYDAVLQWAEKAMGIPARE